MLDTRVAMGWGEGRDRVTSVHLSDSLLSVCTQACWRGFANRRIAPKFGCIIINRGPYISSSCLLGRMRLKRYDWEPLEDESEGEFAQAKLADLSTVFNGEGSEKLSIVIPAYNEGHRIAETLRAYATALRRLHPEILVELDGCEDGSADVVEDMRRQFPEIRLIEFAERLGKGRGVLEGIRSAQGSWVAYLDADGALPPEEFVRLVRAALTNKRDGVIASRYWDRGGMVARYGFLRWTASRAFNRLIRLLYRLPFRDTQCGAKLFRREAMEQVDDSMTLAGYAFDVELLWRMHAAGLDIEEVSVRWTHQDGSSVRVMKVALRMLFDVLRLRVQG